MCERLIPQSLTYIETYIYTYWITVVENRVTHMQVRSNTIHIRLLFLRLWHTHTHTDRYRVTHACTHTPTHTHLLSIRLWHRHSHARTRAHTHTLTYCLSGCDTVTRAHTHLLSQAVTQTHSHARTRAHTHLLSQAVAHPHISRSKCCCLSSPNSIFIWSVH